ncbi:hypothetical protein IE53DRAFT_384545 [Violaceomyces palustris]|uniref:Uncharacterized protein n=1 Tax=Violaceomyces palustris TaxID=1673888 RepID=A0ACD0P4M8_9BASI|nr:hypothetical protein IE53DRAFT_384545 [Violaceomyces palustris]
MSAEIPPATKTQTLPFPEPNPTASLILSHKPLGKRVLIVGTGKLAASRAFACLEAGIKPVVLRLEPEGSVDQAWCQELSYRLSKGQLESFQAPDQLCQSTDQRFNADEREKAWDRVLDELDGLVVAHDDRTSGGRASSSGSISENSLFAVCVTDTLKVGDEDQTRSRSDPSLPAKGTAEGVDPYSRALLLARLCKRRRIPINVADKPELCDFSFPASFRFPCVNPIQGSASLIGSDGSAPAARQANLSSSLQIAVTTNGRGCRLAGRIRRELVGALPRNVGDAVEKVGIMRDMAKQGDRASFLAHERGPGGEEDGQRRQKKARLSNHGTKDLEEEDLSFDATPLNSPVPQLGHQGNPLDKASAILKAKMASQQRADGMALAEKEEEAERTKRRMRWVAQISEYWPIDYLGSLKEEQMKAVLDTYAEKGMESVQSTTSSVDQTTTELVKAGGKDGGGSRDQSSRGGGGQEVEKARRLSQHDLNIYPPPKKSKKKGHIYLLGSGPGHPGLLTVMAHRLLTSPDTHLILSDKLVPAPILRLIPPGTDFEIAKKFPGNAEGAQSELIAKALKAALEEGKNVVRLKQGDPFVYGRGGEEVLAFRRAGIECTVVPGISSAIAAPLMLGIPVTQRGSADSLILCTGVGRGGKKVKLPGYERSRTLLVLMGVARLKSVVEILTGENEGGERDGAAFPPNTPIAIIERASSKDQRMVASTLDGIVQALERSGEQRPPGMMMIGWSVLSLEGEGDLTCLDEDVKRNVETTTGGGERVMEGEEVREQEQGPGRGSYDQEIRRKDDDRITRWLGEKGYLIKEGLDEHYSKSLSDLVGETWRSVHDGVKPNGSVVVKAEGVPVGSESIALERRDESGWAGPRYGNQGRPQGGWVEGEAPNVPALDEIIHAQDLEYARIQAGLLKRD